MKKISLFSAFVAGMLMVSCSSEVIQEDHGSWGNDGTSYINLAINLPTQPNNVTRAENDKFDDGIADEYKVNDATLLLFKGANALPANYAKLTLVTNREISMGAWNQDIDNDQITTQKSKVVQINSIDKGSDNIFAVVVLNGKTLLAGKTINNFKDFLDLKLDLAASNGIAPYMSNTVYAANPGTTTTNTAAFKLINVTDNIQPTEAEAAKKPAAEIFVERGCAKVTASENWTGNNEIEINETQTIKAVNLGFYLVNTNKESFAMRHWDNTWFSLKSDASNPSIAANPYRFTGITKIADAETTGSIEQINGTAYRTYWGEDINYNTPADAANGTIFTAENKVGSLDHNAKYCNENTFDVDHQRIKFTTCAIVGIKFTLNDGSEQNFYTFGDSKDKLYLIDDAKTVFKNKAITYKPTGAEFSGFDFDANDVQMTFSPQDENGIVKAASITLVGKKAGESNKDYTLTTEQLAAVNTLNCTRYNNGTAYYTVPIKHFGDELTPWSATGKTEAYPSTDTNRIGNYLGRYGVLRNNWYDLNITAVKALGSAVPDHVTNDPTWDDDIANYLSVKINVLSWAKRTQGVVL